MKKETNVLYEYREVSACVAGGTVGRYEYCVVTNSRVPCAYVKLPNDHPYFNKNYGECEIEVHGGLTYSDIDCRTQEGNTGWWLGWDYGHFGDFTDTYLEIQMFNAILAGTQYEGASIGADKIWTVDEIVNECHSVIGQLRAVEVNNAD